jgi:hypothetical protein
MQQRQHRQQTRRLRPLAWLAISGRLRMQRQRLRGLPARRRAILLARACRLAKLLGGAVWALGLDLRALKGLLGLLTAKTAKIPAWLG